MASETSYMHLVNDRLGGRALEWCVAFPIVSASINHDALHRGGCIVALEASGIAAVIPGNDYAAPVRVKENFGRIKAHPTRGIERTVYAITIKLPRPQARHEHMPVVVVAVGHGIDRNYARAPGIIFAVKEQQIHSRRPTGKHAEIDPARNDRGPEGRAVTRSGDGCLYGDYAHDIDAASSTLAECRLNRLESLVKSRSHSKGRLENIFSVLRQRQLPSARPGTFIRASFPRFSKSCNGAIASAATEDHARPINAGATSPFPLWNCFTCFHTFCCWSSGNSSNQPRLVGLSCVPV